MRPSPVWAHHVRFLHAVSVDAAGAHNFAWLALAFAVRGLKESGGPSRKAIIISEAAPELRARTYGVDCLLRDCTVTSGSFSSAWPWHVSPRANFIGAALRGARGTIWLWRSIYLKDQARISRINAYWKFVQIRAIRVKVFAMTRRKFIKSAALAAAATPLLTKTTRAEAAVPAKLKGNIHHSVCRWCYDKIKLDDLCAAGKEMGLVAIDLLNPQDFETVRKYGLVCAMVSNPTIDGLGGITKAFNRVEHHDQLVQAYTQRLKETADAGFERLICFSGNRAGLGDAEGLDNCAAGLKKILPLAEKLKVTLCMELLNSKRNHRDYQCDRVAWGVELVKRISSERFKLLYDIYHMQIMDGDICDTIRENHPCFDHYHTGGVPGRAEIDETQELNWPRIMQAIVATGFKGYVAQEFVPKRSDKLASLRQAVTICDV